MNRFESKAKQLELFREIVAVAQTGDYTNLEDMIYGFGSLLSEKDRFERVAFTYMVSRIRQTKTKTG